MYEKLEPGRLLPALAIALALAGCREVPVTAASVLTGFADGVVARQDLLVPGTRWQEHGQSGWAFRNTASLLCWIREAADSTLVVRLAPDTETALHHFEIRWDGGELAAQRIRQDEEGLRIELAPEQLTPGRHELSLKRDYKRDAREHRQRHHNVFEELSYSRGGERRHLALDQLSRYQLLAGFLQHKVMGTTRERRGGLVFVGPSRHSVSLPRTAPGKLRLEPQNFSSRPATFRLRGAARASATVEPGRRGVLTTALDAGAEPLSLEVEGEDGGFFLWGMPTFTSAAEAALPPIVLITLDTTRRDALGVYNPGLGDVTPTLDRLAGEATVYERAYSTAPWTLPSHASLFTGLYPSKHGAGVSSRRLGQIPTLATLLRRRGYLTAGFSSGDLSSSRFGLAQGFLHYRDPDQFDTPGERLAGYLDTFLDEHAELPLFLFVNYFDAHALYRAPAVWEEKLGVPALADKIRGKEAWDDLMAGKMKAWRTLVEGAGQRTPQTLDYLRAAYLAEVAYTDHLLGRLFDRLRRLSLYERALIVVTADHGELLGEGGYLSHSGRLDPELVEIPLLIKWPGAHEPRSSRRLVSLVDLFPTLLHAAGVEAPASDGRLLMPGTDNGSPPHPYVFLEEHQSMVHPLPKNLKLANHVFGVQRGAFRQLIWEEQQQCSRLAAGGWHEESCATEAPNVLAAIRAQLGLATLEEGDEAAVPEELRESLEALGYM